MPAAVRAGLDVPGLAVDSVNMRDLTLPNDMRALLNRVVEAEKAAQANLIRRRKETAATRSALNTARLMDDNPTPLRLKELETLKRLIEKMEQVDLQAGAEGMDGCSACCGRVQPPFPGHRGADGLIAVHHQAARVCGWLPRPHIRTLQGNCHIRA